MLELFHACKGKKKNKKSERKLKLSRSCLYNPYKSTKC